LKAIFVLKSLKCFSWSSFRII